MDQFRANRFGTECAKIFVFVSLGEHQKKALAHRDSAFTLRTIEFGGIKLLEGFVFDRTGRRNRFTTIKESTLHNEDVVDCYTESLRFYCIKK